MLYLEGEDMMVSNAVIVYKASRAQSKLGVLYTGSGFLGFEIKVFCRGIEAVGPMSEDIWVRGCMMFVCSPGIYL